MFAILGDMPNVCTLNCRFSRHGETFFAGYEMFTVLAIDYGRILCRVVLKPNKGFS